MKNASFLVMAGLVCLAFGGSAARAAEAQDPADELRALRAENKMIKAALEQRNKEVAALKGENAKLAEQVAKLDEQVMQRNKEVAALKVDNAKMAEKAGAYMQLEDISRNAGISLAQPTTVPVATPAAIPKAATPENTPAPKDIWAGFRGLKWGTNIADAPGMVLCEDAGDAKFYRRKDDKLEIGGAELTGITYGFYKGRLYYVIIRAKGSTNWYKFRDAVFATYGKGYQSNQFIEDWYWGTHLDMGMMLEYSEITEKVSLSMHSKSIQAEEDADEAKKAKEAKKDF